MGQHGVGSEHEEEVGEVGHGDAQEGAGLHGEVLPQHRALPGGGRGRELVKLYLLPLLGT